MVLVEKNVIAGSTASVFKNNIPARNEAINSQVPPASPLSFSPSQQVLASLLPPPL